MNVNSVKYKSTKPKPLISSLRPNENSKLKRGNKHMKNPLKNINPRCFFLLKFSSIDIKTNNSMS